MLKGKLGGQALAERWRQASNVPPLTSQLPACEHGGASSVAPRERARDSSTVGAGSFLELEMAPLSLLTFLGDQPYNIGMDYGIGVYS